MQTLVRIAAGRAIPKYYSEGPLKGSLTAGYVIARAETRRLKKRAKILSKYVSFFSRIANTDGFVTAAEKGLITKYEKALRYADHLFPLRGRNAIVLKDKWFEASPLINGNSRHYKKPIRIPALQIRGIGDNAKLTIL
jgi:hypothetical protein